MIFKSWQYIHRLTFEFVKYVHVHKPFWTQVIVLF